MILYDNHPMRNRFWAQRRTLVTGYRGFLGSWLVSALLDSGAVVIGFSRQQGDLRALPNDETLNDKIVRLQGRIEHYAMVEQVVKEYDIDTVFHLAAQSMVGDASQNPLLTFETNIQGTWNVLEACRNQASPCRVVLLSSEKVYGNQPDRTLCGEDTVPQADSPYAVSKLCAELLARSYQRSYGLPVATARCSNLYGPGDFNLSRIVPGTISAILNDRRPIIGSDGSPRRDFVYVGDIVEGLLRLAERMENASVQGREFNFASGEQISVLDLSMLLLTIAGREDLQPVVLNTSKPELPQPAMSAALAARLLDWQPKTKLWEGLHTTYCWYRAHYPCSLGQAVS